MIKIFLILSYYLTQSLRLSVYLWNGRGADEHGGLQLLHDLTELLHRPIQIYLKIKLKSGDFLCVHFAYFTLTGEIKTIYSKHSKK